MFFLCIYFVNLAVFGRGKIVFFFFFGLACVANSLTQVRVEQRLRLAQNLEKKRRKKTPSGSGSLYSMRQRCATAPQAPAEGHTRSNIHIYGCIFRNVATSTKKQETRQDVLQNFGSCRRFSLSMQTDTEKKKTKEKRQNWNRRTRLRSCVVIPIFPQQNSAFISNSAPSFHHRQSLRRAEQQTSMYYSAGGGRINTL